MANRPRACERPQHAAALCAGLTNMFSRLNARASPWLPQQ
ncbi:hypothetical protein Pan44_29000 [Caulifigura coniformis]|uniref:Uncharacterized protein n=1 Tax=Caulifigura coniformis TaxID=2527983 RepID=A0A517SFF7_9PLAN|nr:hypothetical protein Pan44_29000 [Caulifigura coniformis]